MSCWWCCRWWALGCRVSAAGALDVIYWVHEANMFTGVPVMDSEAKARTQATIAIYRIVRDDDDNDPHPYASSSRLFPTPAESSQSILRRRDLVVGSHCLLKSGIGWF
ncbi:uncharacterized protein EI90DRAFT_3044371 [Cantharellus anzutake]|uniref:uncharacterized protein n=1 Tax=Cantharellus anzutake TaxID=1750568 RepID=UPI00190600C7|nr:uncharacterized protein EI90DRAFT_3044371 [Cantharellus anzutake]KAF8336969.1 hypothetical protein EI90DRAFT_3044371 [Cantharellus anzutake]